MNCKLLSFSVLATVLMMAKDIQTPVQAKPETYKCESYKAMNGQWRYRISPPLQGSFSNTPNSQNFMNCFIPVSSKKCRYDNNTGDDWHECGKCKKAPNDPFNFCLREGYGEIIEVPNRGRYRAFRTGTTIVLD